jgi:WD40 repeat protein
MRRITSKLFALFWISCILNLPTLEDTIANNQYYGIIRTLEWSHDGTILAVGGDDGLWLYDENFVETAHFTDFAGPVSSISWSPDDTMLAVLLNRWPDPEEWQSYIITLSVESGEILMSVRELFSTPVIWSPDGTAVAAGDYSGEIRAWDALTGEVIFYFEQNVEDYRFYPNSATVVCWNAEENQIVGRFFLGVYVVDVETESSLSFIPVPSVLWGSGACNPTTTVLVTTDSYYANLETGEFIDNWIDNDSTYSFAMSWSPDGNRLAVNSQNHVVEVWNTSNGELITALEGGMVRLEEAYNEYNDSLAWSPDGSMLAEAGQDGMVRIWDAETYELIEMLDFTA